jgi:hypothetical protein
VATHQGQRGDFGGRHVGVRGRSQGVEISSDRRDCGQVADPLVGGVIKTHLQHRMNPSQRSRAQAGFGQLVDPLLDRLVIDLADRPSTKSRLDPQPPNVLVTTAHLGTQVQPRRQPGLVDGREHDAAGRWVHYVPRYRLGNNRCLKDARHVLGFERLPALRPVRQSPFDVKPRTKLGFAASKRHRHSPSIALCSRVFHGAPTRIGAKQASTTLVGQVLAYTRVDASQDSTS